MSIFDDNVRHIYNRAVAGDPVARSFVGRALSRARRGDRRAVVVVGALQALDRSRSWTHNRIKAQDLYDAVLRRDISARKTLGQILSGVRGGRPSAVRAYKLLQDVHLQRKASSWTGPGSPRTGHHPMPYHHRVGVYIPGLGEVNVPSIPGMPSAPQPSPMPIPGFQALTPQALIELLAFAQRILSAAVPPMRMAPPPTTQLPYRAPAPRMVETTMLPKSLIMQADPMVATTMKRSAWMFQQ